MKILKTLLLTATLLLFNACGNKTAFKLQEPLDNAALVYVYAKVSLDTSGSSNRGEYALRINNKPIMQRINDGEYMILNLKPQVMTLSATKNQIQEVVLDLDLKKGETYYLKIVDSQDGSAFDFVKVKNSEAKMDIASTGLAGSSKESPQNIITELINPKNSEPMEVKAVSPIVTPVATQAPLTSKVQMQTAPMSKTDEIMKAYGLKEKGIIDEQEFKILKTNILNK